MIGCIVQARMGSTRLPGKTLLKIDNEKMIPLKLKLSYMDALNKEYSEDMVIDFNVMSASELGVSSNGTSRSIFGVIILGIVGYYFYKRYKKKKKKESKYK